MCVFGYKMVSINMPLFNITLIINVTFHSLRWSCTYLNRTLNKGTNLSVALSMLIVVTIKYGIRNGHPESQMPGSIGPSVAWQPEYTYIKDIPEIYVLHVIKYFMQAGNIPITFIVNLSISTFFEVKKTRSPWVIISPEKTVQINKHIWLYHNVDEEKKKTLLTLQKFIIFSFEETSTFT